MRDALGNIRTITDGSGNITESRLYSPYGEPYGTTGSSQTTYGFTGEPTDSTGFVHLRARYYNPSLGQFMNLDPKETANRFAYVDGNPVNRTDPSGLLLDESANGTSLWSVLRRRNATIYTKMGYGPVPVIMHYTGGGGGSSNGGGGSNQAAYWREVDHQRRLQEERIRREQARQAQLAYQKRLKDNNSTQQSSTNQSGYIGGKADWGGIGDDKLPPVPPGWVQVGWARHHFAVDVEEGSYSVTGRISFRMFPGYTMQSVDSYLGPPNVYVFAKDFVGQYEGTYFVPTETNAYPHTYTPFSLKRREDLGPGDRWGWDIHVGFTAFPSISQSGKEFSVCSTEVSYDPGHITEGTINQTVIRRVNCMLDSDDPTPTPEAPRTTQNQAQAAAARIEASNNQMEEILSQVEESERQGRMFRQIAAEQRAGYEMSPEERRALEWGIVFTIGGVGAEFLWAAGAALAGVPAVKAAEAAAAAEAARRLADAYQQGTLPDILPTLEEIFANM